MSMNAPKRVLLIVTLRIGDVLLATPLIRTISTISKAWPKTSIDVLVYKNTEGIIVNNSDIFSYSGRGAVCDMS